MRMGFMLLFMFVTGAGFLVASAVTGEAWPLFLIWPAYGVAPLLATRGADEATEPEGQGTNGSA